MIKEWNKKWLKQKIKITREKQTMCKTIWKRLFELMPLSKKKVKQKEW